MTLIVHTVVWGDWHTSLYTEYTLPAICAAIRHARTDARLLIHTDDVARLEPYLMATKIKFRIVPILIECDKYVICAGCEDDAFHRAKVGDIVASINPDCVPSLEVFTAAKAAILGGAKIVGIHSPRVLGSPPIGATASDLNTWNVDNFHPITRESHWGGRAPHPAHIYFAKGNRLILHAFTYGPQVFFIDGRHMNIGTSRENALMDCYKREEFALLMPHEAGFASVTPLEEQHGGFQTVFTPESVAQWFPHNVFHRHYRWLFPLRIPVLGDMAEDIGDVEICRDIIQRIQY